MKTRIVLSLLGCLITTACAASAQGVSHGTVRAPVVCQGPITIRSQADVRSVGASCDSIDGDLIIGGASVTSLEGLEHIRAVRHLVIAGNPRLTSIDGLRGLESAARVTVVQNPALEPAPIVERLKRLQAADDTPRSKG